MGARGVDGAGSVKVKLCTVEAGCSVDAMISTSRVNESCKRSFSCAPEQCQIRITTHLQRLGEHLSNLLLAQVPRATEHRATVIRLALALLLSSSCAGTDCAAQNLRSPPATHRTIAVVQAQNRIGVCEGPCMRALRKARDDVERRQRHGGTRGRSRGRVWCWSRANGCDRGAV